MIIDENVSGFIRSLEPDLPDMLNTIETEGKLNEVPIIKKDAQSVLRFVINSYRPKKVLEIGTAIGFSACYMAWVSSEISITTLEKDENRIITARENIKKTNFSDRISIIEGDAAESLEMLVSKGESFDMVFLDAAKAQYGVYFELVKKLLVPDGILLTDNVLQEGSISASKFSVTRRDRTIHKRMREFIKTVYGDEEYFSMMIPVGDGMMLSQRRVES